MSDHIPVPVPPPRLKPAVVTTPLWTQLPANTQRDLRQLLARLLTRLLEARRLREARHD